jgi:hypothetical protein
MYQMANAGEQVSDARYPRMRLTPEIPSTRQCDPARKRTIVGHSGAPMPLSRLPIDAEAVFCPQQAGLRPEEC